MKAPKFEHKIEPKNRSNGDPTKLIKNRALRNPDTINPAHNTIWAMGSKHTPPRPSRPAHTARSQNKVTQKYTIQSFKVGQTPGFLSP